ncbi:hypothetical protein [Cognatishimia maritima]|uniref:Uncharacterized protein n=1 Tax=Cognatishimia maritima TaxID=870908 RepID=A0A1M5IZL6_9RHOB|nr:hypothetical protein [Cognatishimia maritima]SHG33754.1 hypothetical protein SAMN04488044_0498 [Cognatishimia maritima]
MGQTLDPRGLIREAYRIEGIDLGQCRSIFLDWALGRDIEATAEVIGQLLQQYEVDHPEHPMTEVLREGSVQATVGAEGRRRGGRRRKG